MQTQQSHLTERQRRSLIEEMKIDLAISKRLAKVSLSHFTKVFWPIIEPETDFIEGWHIDAICQHLEAVSRFEIKKIIFNLPPRHMKSILVCVMFPAWVWASYPERRFLFGSHSQALATRDSIKTRMIIESELYKTYFSPDWTLTDDQNQKTIFSNTKSGFRKSIGVGGGITGDGGDYLVIDDPISALDVTSEVIKEEVNRWHDQVWSTRYNDAKRHAKIITMQRLDEIDLTGHVLEKDKKLIDSGKGTARYERLILPARFDPDDPDIISQTSLNYVDPRKNKGELLWPERFDEAALLDLEEDLGENAEGQLQQNPKPRKGGLFPRDKWGMYDKTPSPILETVQFWDCAEKPGVTNDYSVCATWVRTHNGFYCLDVWRDKVDAPTLEVMAVQLFEEYEADAVVIEDKSHGTALIQYLRRFTTLPVLEYDPRQRDKTSRAIAATPAVRGGKCHLPHGADWVKEFKKEHEKFPKGKNDDQVDTTSMMVEYFNKRGSMERGPRVRSI